MQHRLCVGNPEHRFTGRDFPNIVDDKQLSIVSIFRLETYLPRYLFINVENCWL